MADDGACDCLTCVLTKDDLQRLAEESRRAALVEAYWKLRDHAAELRDTTLYRRLGAKRDQRTATGAETNRLINLETRCRGIEDGARDLAEMLGVEEHEIERPAAGTREAAR